MKLFKSDIFLVGILPGLIIITWILLSLINTHEIATPQNLGSTISVKSGIFSIWANIRNIGLILYSLYVVVIIFSSKKGHSNNKLFAAILGMILLTFSWFISLMLFDLYSIIYTLVNNPQQIYHN